MWRLSGSFQLALLATRARCLQVVLDFLRVGGRITPDAIEYRNLRLPRSPFAGAGLTGVAYVRQLGDHGTKVESVLDNLYRIRLPDGLTFEATEESLVMTLCLLAERFVDEEYAWLDAAGRIVLDVGASVGDSILYFATRGALHVYGYEPDAVAFTSAQRTIAMNDIRNVSIVRAAVTGNRLDGAGDQDHVSFQQVLDSLASHHPGVPIVCKIDCEGCEFEILAPGSLEPSALRQVSQIMVEYHWRSPEGLSAELEALGFRVETTSGAPGVGWIRAYKPTVATTL